MNNGNQMKRLAASGKGPADYFTGAVRIDPLFDVPEPARVRSATVTFEPGACTAWHTHPLGQTLIVTWGVGGAQHWGRGNPVGRRDLVSAWREALAWSNTLDCDDTYRHSGGAEWQSRGLDGAGKRRGIPSLTRAMPYTDGSRGNRAWSCPPIEMPIPKPPGPPPGPPPRPKPPPPPPGRLLIAPRSFA